MADVKFLANLDVDGNLNLTAGSGYQIKNATFESLTADPTTNNFEGRMIYRSDTNQVRFYDGSAWTSIAGDILGVTAGDGLGGGGTTGTVSLSVNVDDVTTQITSDAVVAKTAAVSEGGENLATGIDEARLSRGQVHTYASPRRLAVVVDITLPAGKFIRLLQTLIIFRVTKQSRYRVM